MLPSEQRSKHTHHDAAFLTPANAMLSVELGHLADLLDSVNLHQNATFARSWSKSIKEAVYAHTISNGIFAYETNGVLSLQSITRTMDPLLISNQVLEVDTLWTMLMSQ